LITGGSIAGLLTSAAQTAETRCGSTLAKRCQPQAFTHLALINAVMHVIGADTAPSVPAPRWMHWRWCGPSPGLPIGHAVSSAPARRRAGDLGPGHRSFVWGGLSVGLDEPLLILTSKAGRERRWGF
jgi:hypothetical protein